MAALHARVFPGRPGWGAGDFADLLASHGAILATTDHAFALGRRAADEAELLLIVTDPDHQRQGHGRRCLLDLETQAAREGARCMFLEVAETNAKARAFYAAQHYEEVARRQDYFAAADGTRETAVVMKRALAPG
jgi:ribosomal-protein-alanine N-acetyltransferase